MAATNQDITLYQGDVVPILFTITDDSNAAIDISAATFTWGLFRVATELPYKTKTLGTGLTITDGPNGKLSLAIVNADTVGIQGDWKHELSMSLGGIIEIVAAGAFTIQASSVQ